jgi:hypothetical protein
VVVPAFGSPNAVPEEEQDDEPKWNFHVKVDLRFSDALFRQMSET